MPGAGPVLPLLALTRGEAAILLLIFGLVVALLVLTVLTLVGRLDERDRQGDE